MKKFIQAAILMSWSILLLSLPATALAATAGSGAGAITITGPTSGGTVVDTGVQVIGISPAHTLIHVTIIDVVSNRTNVKHIPGGKLSGTARSDQDGQWIYVPATQLIPGQYAVKAYYVATGNKNVSSLSVPFVVMDAKGNSVTLSFGLERNLSMGLLAFAGALFAYIFVVVRRDKSRLASKEAELIERELDQTTDHLIQTNQEINELRERVIRNEQRPRPK